MRARAKYIKTEKSWRRSRRREENESGSSFFASAECKVKRIYNKSKKREGDREEKMLPPIISNINSEILTLYTSPNGNEGSGGGGSNGGAGPGANATGRPTRGRYAEIGVRR